VLSPPLGRINLSPPPGQIPEYALACRPKLIFSVLNYFKTSKYNKIHKNLKSNFK